MILAECNSQRSGTSNARQAQHLRPGRHRRGARRGRGRCRHGSAEDDSRRPARDGGQGKHPSHRAGPGQPRLRIGHPGRTVINLAPADLPQGRRRLRSADRARHAGRHGATAAGASRRISPSSASWPSTAACGRSRARCRWRWRRRNAASASCWCRRRTPARPPWSRRSRSMAAGSLARSGRHPVRAAAGRAGHRRHSRSCSSRSTTIDVDFADVRGQEFAKRALVVAAAGGHNVLMIGTPGTGKTMLAQRLPTILPPLTPGESLETTRIYSAMGRLQPDEPLLATRPFRSPHHTISDAGMVGGGNPPGAGRNLPGPSRRALPRRAARVQPPQPGSAAPAARGGQGHHLAGPDCPRRSRPSFVLVAAMNPCPCGYLGDPRHACKCTPMQIERYMGRISGPLLDRIDLHIEVPGGAVPGAVRQRGRHLQRDDARAGAARPAPCSASVSARDSTGSTAA